MSYLLSSLSGHVGETEEGKRNSPRSIVILYAADRGELMEEKREGGRVVMVLLLSFSQSGADEGKKRKRKAGGAGGRDASANSCGLPQIKEEGKRGRGRLPTPSSPVVAPGASGRKEKKGREKKKKNALFGGRYGVRREGGGKEKGGGDTCSFLLTGLHLRHGKEGGKKNRADLHGCPRSGHDRKKRRRRRELFNYY